MSALLVALQVRHPTRASSVITVGFDSDDGA
ncbi:Uncharacterised protein [Mycobacteroides abscessus]|nr:Uncharacterised protein [Mycobacteroides abscessus]